MIGRVIRPVVLIWWLTFSSSAFAAVSDHKADTAAGVEAFFYNQPTAYALSPAGRWLAFVISDDIRPRLYTRNIETGAGFQLNGYDGEVDQVAWIDESRLVFRVRLGAYIKLFQTDPKGTVFWDFTPKDNCVASLLSDQPLASKSGKVYFSMTRTDGTTALYALLTAEHTGGRLPILRISENPKHVEEWLFSPNGAIIGGVKSEGNQRVLWSMRSEPNSMDEWTEVFRSTADEFPHFTAYGAPPGMLLASAYFENEHACVRIFDPKSRKFGATLVDPADESIREVIFTPDRRQIGAYVVRDRPSALVPVLPKFQGLDGSIRNTIKSKSGTTPIPAALSDDYSRAIVVEESDQAPAAYWHVDLTGNKSFAFFSPPNSSVGIGKVMEPWAVRSRDAMKLPCYKVSSSKSGPADPIVVVVGGGPFESIHREWAPLVQFLAANGSTVVAMNYRGATGFGRSFHLAGTAQCNGAMITDVEDVVHAIKQEVWGRNRPIVLLAFSFGGFLTVKAADNLVGAVQGLILVNPLLNVADFFKRTVENGGSSELADYEIKKWFGPGMLAGLESTLIPPTGAGVLVVQSSSDLKISPTIARQFADTASRTGSASYVELHDTHEIDRIESWRKLATNVLEYLRSIPASAQLSGG